MLYSYKKKFFHKEAIISLIFHFLKSIIVLYINWLVLNKLTVEDYVFWSITSSILMVATSTDFGIGQHTVAVLINTKDKFKKNTIYNSLFSILPLAIITFFFIFFSLNENYLYNLILSILVSFRILSIPFGAFLNATNKFKIRKIIEFISYSIAMIAITIIIFKFKSVKYSLIALNFSFFIGAILIILNSIKLIPKGNISFNNKIFYSFFIILKKSFPFLINNLVVMLTYGGFIWISSYFLDANSLAKLSVLHTFFFMSLYQVYDVYLRSRQADLIIKSKVKFLFILNKKIISFMFLFFLIFGSFIFILISPFDEIDYLVIVLFALFNAIEFSFLLIQSVVQANIKFSNDLYIYSLIKFLFYLITLIILKFLLTEIDLIKFLTLHVLFSFISLLLTNIKFKKKMNFSLL